MTPTLPFPFLGMVVANFSVVGWFATRTASRSNTNGPSGGPPPSRSAKWIPVDVRARAKGRAS